MNRSESIVKLAAALVKSQSEMGNATKDAKNPFFKSKYADLNAIREVSLPVLNRNGISVLQPLTAVDGKQYIETLLLHESGEFISSLTEVIIAKQNDPQAAGSGISYSRRYGLQSILNIGAEDDDSESNMSRGKESIPVKTNKVESSLAGSESVAASSTAQAASAAQATTVAQAATVSKPSPFRGKPATTVKQQTSSPSDAF
jgi:hypothetical protein